MIQLKRLRLLKGIKSQKEMAQMLGVPYSTYNYWENGKFEIDFENLKRISNIFNVSIDYLLGKTDLPIELSKSNYNDNVVPINMSNITFEKIPVLGSIAAGTPMEAIENNDIDDYIVADSSSFQSGIFFGLRIKGDSMEPRICEGDVAIIRACDWVDTGDIAAVRVNGGDTTLKQVRFEQNGMWLIGYNPTFQPIYYTAKNCSELPVTVIGKLVQVIQQY